MMKEGQLQFGVFTVNLRDGELHRNGQKIKLQEQPFRFLAALIDRPGEIVTREELACLLWPDAVVDAESGLNTAVKKLRIALGDDASAPVYVETVPKHGYRLIAPVQAVSAPAVQVASPITEAPVIEAPPPRAARSWRFALMCAACLELLLLGGALLVRPGSAVEVQRMGSGSPTVLAVSPDKSELLVKLSNGNEKEEGLWIVPTAAGPAHRVGNAMAQQIRRTWETKR